MTFDEKDLEDELDLTRSENPQAWLESYSDVVTLLLCFFIIFLHMKDKAYISGAFKIESKDIPHVANKLEQTQISGLLQQLANDLQNFHQGSITMDHFAIYIDFGRGAFFEKGRWELNDFARNEMTQVLPLLKEYQDRVDIEIQGHTDNVPIDQSRAFSYKSNLELSVMRSLKVFEFLKTSGVYEENMSVKGYGRHRQVELAKKDISEEERLAWNRRISLRIGLK